VIVAPKDDRVVAVMDQVPAIKLDDLLVAIQVLVVIVTSKLPVLSSAAFRVSAITALVSGSSSQARSSAATSSAIFFSA
jgi:hypothetical protein